MTANEATACPHCALVGDLDPEAMALRPERARRVRKCPEHGRYHAERADSPPPAAPDVEAVDDAAIESMSHGTLCYVLRGVLAELRAARETNRALEGIAEAAEEVWSATTITSASSVAVPVSRDGFASSAPRGAKVSADLPPLRWATLITLHYAHVATVPLAVDEPRPAAIDFDGRRFVYYAQTCVVGQPEPLLYREETWP